jgi:hypothetical protein
MWAEIKLLMLIVGLFSIGLAFILVLLRRVVFWLVIIGGTVISIILTILLLQIFPDAICSAGFFGGLMVYVAAVAYAAKRIMLANAIALYALGSFLVLWPLMELSVYAFAIIWFVMTFGLFYLGVKIMKSGWRIFPRFSSERYPAKSASNIRRRSVPDHNSPKKWISPIDMESTEVGIYGSVLERFCTNCGAKSNSTERFCIDCGEMIDDR